MDNAWTYRYAALIRRLEDHLPGLVGVRDDIYVKRFYNYGVLKFKSHHCKADGEMMLLANKFLQEEVDE